MPRIRLSARIFARSAGAVGVPTCRPEAFMPYLSSSARICVADRPLSVNSSMLPISHVAQLPEHVLALRLRRGVLAEADDVGERELLDRDLIDGHPSPGAVRLG